MTDSIKNNPDAHRYETILDGLVCELNYSLDEGVMSMNRVYVPPALEGRGIAGALTKFALDDCADNQWAVIPRCPYVAAWIKRHPEYHSLVYSPD